MWQRVIGIGVHKGKGIGMLYEQSEAKGPAHRFDHSPSICTQLGIVFSMPVHQRHVATLVFPRRRLQHTSCCTVTTLSDAGCRMLCTPTFMTLYLERSPAKKITNTAFSSSSPAAGSRTLPIETLRRYMLPRVARNSRRSKPRILSARMVPATKPTREILSEPWARERWGNETRGQIQSRVQV